MLQCLPITRSSLERRLSVLLLISVILTGCDNDNRSFTPQDTGPNSTNGSSTNNDGGSEGGDPSNNSNGDTPGGTDPNAQPPADNFVVIRPFVPDEQKQPLTIADAKPFRTASAYSSVLKTCYQVAVANACNLGVLPLIGQEAAEPTIDSIMNRVVVTHDWMGTRFEQILSRYSQDELNLFKPVAIIFIGSSVNNSTYLGGKAVLELGPSLLWLTPDEKFAIETNTSNDDTGITVNTRDALQFSTVFFNLKDNIIVDSNSDQTERDWNSMFYRLTPQLYQRSIFAANRINPATYTAELSNTTPLDLFSETTSGLFAQTLHDDPTLTDNDSELYGLANVYYKNMIATDFQKTRTAGDVGARFANQGKMDFFSYTSPVADAQQLFAAGMLLYKHGITTDILFLDAANANFNQIIGFGQSNRMASGLVAPRAKFVMQAVLGSSAQLDQFFESGLGELNTIAAGTPYNQYLSTTTAAGF